MKTIVAFLTIFVLIVPVACMARLPDAAKELAVSTLCDFPGFSGRNMCQSVSISRILANTEESVESEGGTGIRHWCVELKYVDYTGESGTAIVWVAGPTEKGEFILDKGPSFGGHCQKTP